MAVHIMYITIFIWLVCTERTRRKLCSKLKSFLLVGFRIQDYALRVEAIVG